MIQRLIDILYRHPMSGLRRRTQFGGLIAYRRMMRNQRSMTGACRELPPVKSHADGLPVYFLTGKKYLYQTLFCITSLNRASTEKFRFTLLDDGTIDQPIVHQIERQLPGAQIILKSEIENRLEEALPLSRFPVLRAKRKVYPHIKKLTDVHTLTGDAWKLVLDSDMLFFADPVHITNWLKAPSMSLHMKDCTESYGYSIALMEKLTGAPVPRLLNVGAIGLQSSAINWDDLENWVSILEEQEGKTYYLEQALSAMIIGGSPALELEAVKYIVNPGSTLIGTGGGILHHYVDMSKKGYYNTAWRRFIVG